MPSRVKPGSLGSVNGKAGMIGKLKKHLLTLRQLNLPNTPAMRIPTRETGRIPYQTHHKENGEVGEVVVVVAVVVV